MTALDKIRNDYEDHKGQEKLRLRPQLVTDLQFLNKNQRDLLQTISLGDNCYFNRLSCFLDNVTGDMDQILEKSFHIDKDNSNDDLEERPFRTSKYSNAKPLGGSIDGAAFIYTMNVYVQLAYIEKYIFNNLPKEVYVKYLTDLIGAKDLMNSFIKTIQEVMDISTYNPKYTTFETVYTKLGLIKHKVTEPLDTPVSK